MSGSTLDELHQGWLKRPGYKAAYDALEEEFAIASAPIAPRQAPIRLDSANEPDRGSCGKMR